MSWPDFHKSGHKNTQRKCRIVTVGPRPAERPAGSSCTAPPAGPSALGRPGLRPQRGPSPGSLNRGGACRRSRCPPRGPRSLWPSPGGEGVTRLTFTSYLLPQTVYQSVPQNKNRRTSGDRPKMIFPNYKYERGNRGSKASRDPPKARESYCLPPVN